MPNRVHVRRASAAGSAAVLLGAVVLAAPAPSDAAAAAPQVRGSSAAAFVPPTTITYLRNTCVKESDDQFKVTYVWRVSGGRYANWGSVNTPRRKPENIYHGETRTIKNVVTIQGTPSNEDNGPGTVLATGGMYVAPIERPRRIREIDFPELFVELSPCR